eukprot:4505743-Amphidinium_carterae.2
MEYQTPGADVRTLVVQDWCRLAAFVATSFKASQGAEQQTTEGALETIQCCIFLQPTLRLERTPHSTTCKPSSFHDAPPS